MCKKVSHAAEGVEELGGRGRAAAVLVAKEAEASGRSKRVHGGMGYKPLHACYSMSYKQTNQNYPRQLPQQPIHRLYHGRGPLRRPFRATLVAGRAPLASSPSWRRRNPPASRPPWPPATALQHGPSLALVPPRQRPLGWAVGRKPEYRRGRSPQQEREPPPLHVADRCLPPDPSWGPGSKTTGGKDSIEFREDVPHRDAQRLTICRPSSGQSDKLG